MKRIMVMGALALVAVAPAWAQVKVDETRPLAPDGVVEVSNLAGSVHVIGWKRDQVEITGVLGGNVEGLDISGNQSRLEIEVEVPRHADDLETDLTIRMPATAGVEVETVSASVLIEGMIGEVDLESVSGSVRISDEPRELSVQTVSGSIAVAVAPSRAELSSVSGSITVERAGGELDVENVSGNIDILGGLLDAASCSTVSGNIKFAADLGGRGVFDFESMSGTIVVEVAPGVSAEFDVTTFSGSIENAIGPAARNTSKYTPEKELSFTAGSGDARVSASSFSGTVKIVSR